MENKIDQLSAEDLAILKEYAEANNISLEALLKTRLVDIPDDTQDEPKR